MSRLLVPSPDRAQATIDGLYGNMERRIAANPSGVCPIDTALAFLELCHTQSCGKCVPCRVGLGKLADLLRLVLDGSADEDTLRVIRETAQTIVDSADCVIGTNAADMVLTGLNAFEEDYLSHIRDHCCIGGMQKPVPCVAGCPAGVDIPGYIALIKDGRPADAVRLIRRDNPFPIACAYICEHPCEHKCRRMMIDDAINIRGLKKYAVTAAGDDVPNPPCAPSTGKKIAVIGGGPSGLTAAYYLTLMGHSVTVYDRRRQLGGMLRYGIPSYRFPRERLDAEIKSILSVGITAYTNVDIGTDISLEQLKSDFDCIYISIGAQGDKRTGMPGEDSRGVISAVEMLRGIGDNLLPNFHGKKVVIVGGGNVAMDVTRSSIRLGAEKVTCVYRRRSNDMTALPEEVEGAMAEGAEIVTLQAPVRVEADENGNAVALWTKPQIIGEIDRSGRPRPCDADLPERRIEADIIVLAIGQSIESADLESAGIPVKRGSIIAGDNTVIPKNTALFAGGDCVTGPATAIRAIAAGKAAAANIDEFLGFRHEISVDVQLPPIRLENKPAHGRVNLQEREALERRHDFTCIECDMTCQEACTEAGRCLQCDHFGYGSFKGGRIEKW